MIITDTALIVSRRPLGEKSFLIACLTKNNGMISGMAKNIGNSKKLSYYEIGNHVKINHFSNENKLGIISVELIKSYSLDIINNHKKLNIVILLCELIYITFKNAETSHTAALPQLIFFLESFQQTDIITLGDLANLTLVVRLLLQEMGINFQVNKCIVCDIKEPSQLIYLSPKSANAVSLNCGAPYKEKLFHLPLFLINNDRTNLTSQDVINGMKIIDFFMKKISIEYFNSESIAAWNALYSKIHKFLLDL